MTTKWTHMLFDSLTRPGARGASIGRGGLVRETLVFTTRLPSASDGLRFDAAFSLKVVLHTVGENEQARLLARLKNSVVESAHEEAQGFALGDYGLAEAALFRALNGPDHFGGDRIDDLTVRVTLTVSDEDIALERRRELVGQRAQLARAEHQARMERVEELITEVFKDPVTARMWWFEQNQDRWTDIRGAGEALDSLVALCARRDDSERFTPGEQTRGEGTQESGGKVPEDPILAAFLSGVDGKARDALLVRLTDILDAYDRPDLVRRLHESWSEQ